MDVESDLINEKGARLTFSAKVIARALLVLLATFRCVLRVTLSTDPLFSLGELFRIPFAARTVMPTRRICRRSVVFSKRRTNQTKFSGAQMAKLPANTQPIGERIAALSAYRHV
jgi:hypothetical protein